MKIHKILSANPFNESIESVLVDVEEKFGVYITLHDHLDCFILPDGTSVMPEHRHVHAAPYCKSGRTPFSEWDMLQCPRDCFQVSDTIAVREARPFTKTCWKGVFELVVPIMRGDSVAIVLFAGAWRGKIPKETTLSREYRNMHRELPPAPSEKKLAMLTNTLSVIGSGLISRLEALTPTESSEGGRREVIRRFINQNFHRQIKLEDLARHLYISPSRTSHIINQLFDMPFKQLLTRERMIRARKLLLANWPDMTAVAEAVGYSNVYYFNTAFKKYYGSPPGRFKKNHVR